jgi:hypothetical protein
MDCSVCQKPVTSGNATGDYLGQIRHESCPETKTETPVTREEIAEMIADAIADLERDLVAMIEDRADGQDTNTRLNRLESTVENLQDGGAY